MTDERVYLTLILGASEFPNTALSSSPAFRNSAEAIAHRLESYPAGADTYRVVSLFDSELSVIEQARAIDAALRVNRDATDLIVFYVGHGGFLRRGAEYFLTLRSTADREEDLTALRASTLADVIDRSFADRRVYVVLDCCFAGEAVHSFQSGELGTIVEHRTMGRFPARGTALLVASSRDEPAISNERYTVFCECLLDVLERGIEGAERYLSLGAIADRLRALVNGRYGDGISLPEIHSPRQQDGDVARERLFPNPAYGAHALPDEASIGLGQPLPKTRVGAVDALADYLRSGDPAVRDEARLVLERVAATDDSNLVRSHAREVLGQAGVAVPAGANEPRVDSLPVVTTTEPDDLPVVPAPVATAPVATATAEPEPLATLAIFVQPDRRRVPPDSSVTWTCTVSNTGPIPVRAIEVTDAGGTQLGKPFDLEAGAKRRVKFTRQYGEQGGRLTVAVLGRTDGDALVSAEGSGRVTVRRPARVTDPADGPQARIDRFRAFVANAAGLPRFRQALREVKATADLRNPSVNTAIRLIGEGERHYLVATGRLEEPADWRKRAVEWVAEVAALCTRDLVMVKIAAPSARDIAASIGQLSDHIAASTGTRIPVDEFV